MKLYPTFCSFSDKVKLIFLIFIFCSGSLMAQKIVSIGTVEVYNSQGKANFKIDNQLKRALQEVDKTLLNYVILNVNTEQVYKHVRKGQTPSFQLDFDNKIVALDLYLHDILSHDFRHVIQTENGQKIQARPEAFTYRGVANNNPEDPAVFTIRENWMSGFYTEGGEQYFLTPLQQFFPGSDPNLLVSYTPSDSKSPSFECNVGHSQNDAGYIEKFDKKSSINQLAIQCTEIAVAYDQGFKTLHGGATGVENIIMSRLNLVSNLYQNWFEIEYSLLELYETALDEITPENNFESCQENFPNCSEGTILDDFREWGEGQAESPNFGNGFTSNPDVATFWTSRDIVDGNNDLNIGYSHFEGICNDLGYNICEDAVRYRGNEPLQMTLWAHELGHTWNAYHVNQNNTFMMNSSVTAEATNVANSTLTSIANHKSSRTCLTNNVCFAHCNNGIQDADETGIDCGGADCAACPSCTDGILNGSETGIDCGGPDCPACPAEDCAVLDFNSLPVIDYDSSQDEGTATIQDAGITILLENNAWKAFDISYTVSTNSILTFDFKSTLEGEIHDIGFDDNLNFDSDGPPHRAVVYGDQGYSGNLAVNNYTGSGNWETFQVNIGSEFSGFWQYLVLTADDDGNAPLGNSYFRNIRIFEDNNGNQICDDNNCQNIIIENQNQAIGSSKSADTAIETNGIVEANSNIEYNAGQYILLNSGFEVETTAVFHAYIQSCQ